MLCNSNVYAIVKYTILCTGETKFVNLRNIYPSRGVVGFSGLRQRILQGEGTNSEGGCVKTPVRAMSTYSLLIKALYLAAKFINFPGKI